MANFKNGEDYYNRIYLQFNLFIAISLLPFGYLLLLKQSDQLYTNLPQPWFSLLTFGLLTAIIAITYQAHKRFVYFLASVDSSKSLREKLASYQTHSVKKYLGFMFAGLLCVSGYYLTVSIFFVIAYIVTLALLSIKRPTLNALIEDLRLSEDETKILIDKLPIP